MDTYNFTGESALRKISYGERERVTKSMSCVSFPYRIVLFEELRCIFLSVASDLSNEDDALCLRILQEHLQTIYEVCSVEWIPANTLQETKQTPVVYKRCCEYTCMYHVADSGIYLTRSAHRQ